MTRSHVHRLWTAVPALLLLLVTACGSEDSTDSAGSPNDESASLPVVRYSAFRVVDPAYVAQEQGFFEQRGIEVEFVENPGGTTGLQSTASGRTEAGGAPVPALVSAVAEGLPVVGVADQQSALPGSPVEEFFVLSDSGIDDVSDLKGKRVAVNSVGGSFQSTVVIALEDAGLTADDVEFVVLPFDQQAAALTSGGVDMIGLLPQFGSAALDTFGEDITVLFDALDVFGPKQFVLFAMNSEWVSENRESARAFVGGLADAVAWIDDNPDEARSLLAEYTGLEERFLPEILFQEHAQVVEDDIQFWIDYLASSDAIDEAPAVEDVASNEYNPLVNP